MLEIGRFFDPESKLHLGPLILENSLVVNPEVLPELTLRLVTKDCSWWYQDPTELQSLGINDPYWAFCWPGGAALARFILDHPAYVSGKRVLDFGSGCGVVALAARLSGAKEVIACDIDPLSLWACAENAKLNSLTLSYEGRDLIGERLDRVETLLLADMSYSRDLVDSIWPWLGRLQRAGTDILLADPKRGFLPADLPMLDQVYLSSQLREVPLETSMQVPIFLNFA